MMLISGPGILVKISTSSATYEVRVQHQVCKAHVRRNTEDLIERNLPLVTKDVDGSLQAIGVSPQQVAADLARLGELVKSRQIDFQYILAILV